MMKKICALLVSLLIALSGLTAFAYEDTNVNFYVNGNTIPCTFSSFIRNGVTYVDAQALAITLGLNYKVYPGHESVIISNDYTSACFVPYDECATLADYTGRSDNEYAYKILTAPPIYVNNNLAVAARDIATFFGYSLWYEAPSNTVFFGYPTDSSAGASSGDYTQKAYYFQNQAEFAFPDHGSGYCWVCSYAMVLTNLTGRRITPADVAAVNLKRTSSGAYCYHSDIVSTFGVRFVSALPESSPYYGGRASGNGGTYIKNPTNSDDVTRAALKEALDLHPEGVLVRYAGFPHTMVAVGYNGNTILFNDPAPTSSSSYSTTGRYHCVPFSKTCVAGRYSLSDMSYIQAIGY